MIFNVINKKPINKLIFVCATGRSGSNMLIGLLNSLKSVLMGYELPVPKDHTWEERSNFTSNLVESFISDYINLACSNHNLKENSNKSEYSISGCKFLNSHIGLYNINEGLLNNLADSVKIIHLYRNNLVDQYISLKLARKNNKWIWNKNRNGEYTPDMIEIDIDDLGKFISRHISIKNDYLQLFPSSYIVSYDDIVKDAQGVFENGLFEYLDVDKQIVNFDTMKQNVRNKKDIIVNYDEVKNSFGEYFEDFSNG